MSQRIKNCADCERYIGRGDVLFPVNWSLEYKGDEPTVFFICQDCMKDYMREAVTPGGRI